MDCFGQLAHHIHKITMLEHILLQAMTTAFCGFLIRESYGQATKQLSKRFKSNSEEVERVLTSSFLLSGQQSSVLSTPECHLNFSSNYPDYLQVSSNQSICLPALNISYPTSPLLFAGTSSTYDHNCRHPYNLITAENILIHESNNSNSLFNLLHMPLQEGSDVFADPPGSILKDISKTQKSRNLNTFLFHNAATQDESLPISQPTILHVLLAEREKQIQMLASMIGLAITRPGIYAETYQNHRNTILNTNSETPKYDLRGASFSGGFAETVQGRQIGGTLCNYASIERKTLAEAVGKTEKLLK